MASSYLKHPTLLVITDDPGIRSWMQKHLSSQFFILEATDKDKILETIQFSSLDFIVIDAKLGSQDALALCKEMRQCAGLVPIFLITGRLKKSYRDEALEAGVTDFVNDPLDLDELETRIAVAHKTAALRQKTVNAATRWHHEQKKDSK